MHLTGKPIALNDPVRPPTSTQMQAAVFAGSGEINIQQAAIPKPQPHEVLVRLEGCGICHSNLPVWEGRPWFNYPLEPGTPGHEGWGVVEHVGSAVAGIVPGTRVAMLSNHAYAEFDCASADQLVPIPESMNSVPMPGEPLGCAMNILRRCGIESGQQVAIIGIGFLGALLTQLATRAGAQVIAISRRSSALEMARRMGAAATIAMEDHWKIIEQVRALTAGEGCPCVIEVVGAQWPLDLSGEIVRERGRLVVAGYHQDGLRQVNMQSWNWKGIDVINAHERDPQVYIQGIRRALAAMEEGQLEPTALYTHRFPLKDLPQAFQLMHDHPEGFFKGLVIYD